MARHYHRIEPMRIYVASPLGFSESGRLFHEKALLPMIRAAGHEVIDPWTLTDTTIIEQVKQMPPGTARQQRWREVNAIIGRNNVAGIDRCDAILAVLDGADVDSGTAAEIGYAVAKGKLAIGYRSDFRLTGENEAAAVNLQVEYFIQASGGRIVRNLDELGQTLRELSTGPARPPVTRRQVTRQVQR